MKEFLKIFMCFAIVAVIGVLFLKKIDTYSYLNGIIAGMLGIVVFEEFF